ncbi:hypothetical protein QBC33DRAFT_191942 [Phialemonium atrogriseum]|uniref:Anaphase-promoting complex subunit 2 n=1 Tax=Phialemonium atrogriseum TaxID=1093897 RepID=A0AAJ0FDJ3_9PEZI|nr:uncharacterized protein QBC33DRAFT_191942 [Phialemonium atrogriseum]KAK1764651.1 hypothetical protein QBC33DRAFT_191942 [Phialemonium atrogriseum]
MAVAVTSKWRSRRQRVYQSVFQTDISQPTPYSTPSLRFPEQGQPFGGHLPISQLDRHLFHAHGGSAVPSAAIQGSSFEAQPTQSQLGNELAPPDVNASSSSHVHTIPDFLSPSQPSGVPLFPVQNAAEDQIRYDRAWHVVTSRIALPSSATAEDSFGTLAPESQYQSQSSSANSEAEFYDALRLVVNAHTALPWAAHTEDIIMWHTQQVRRHFSQHVMPLLSACTEGQTDAEDSGAEGDGRRGNYYEKHMVVVMSSVRTLEAALRLYSYGLQLIVRGLQRLGATGGDNTSADPRLMATRFRRDIHALVSNSASPRLMRSLRFVLIRLIGGILGVPSGEVQNPVHNPTLARPAPPSENDLKSLAARKRLFELMEPLYNVGLTGEKFQILFAEVMDGMMSDFVQGAYAGVWTTSRHQSGFPRSKMGTPITGLLATNASSASPCITSLCDWVENHYARLAIEVLSRLTTESQSSNQPPVTLADVKTYQSLALGRLAALRISELFDIVLAWPSSRGALDDLRAAITTPARRLQLTDSFAEALERRLLHPGRSTLEILQTYMALIRTFHTLDQSKVLLARVVPSLELYLCSREDAVRIVVTGLLASPEEIRAARIEKALKEPEASSRGAGFKDAEAGPFMTPALPGRGPSSKQGTPSREAADDEAGIQELPEGSAAAPNLHPGDKLVELALLLNDPAQSRRAMGPDDDADLDWSDMSWVPDPVDAGANYKRARSEDVIGTLISSLGSRDAFIREFQVIVAERLLTDRARFDQEIRVLNLLKKRFGESALQDCDVMVRDILDSRRLNATIRKGRGDVGKQPVAGTPANLRLRGKEESEAAAAAPYHARILSRLFWPNLDREHFLLPAPVAEQQKEYEQGYEHLKSSRKLTWLNQLGQATVELELQDRTVTTECKTYEATVIYAFQDDPQDSSRQPTDAPRPPARRSVQDLVDQLQMDDDLVLSALDFWASKGVLRRSQGDIYSVVETLSGPTTDGSRAPTGERASPTAVGADNADNDGDDDYQQQREARGSPPKGRAAAAVGVGMGEKERARRQMYWQYVRGMLTNAKATMALAQVGMMMRMLVADGFPWGDEELQGFLGEKVAEGELEVVGGKYRLVKK